MRKLATILILSSVAFAVPTLAQVPTKAPAAVRLLWTPAQIAKARTELALQEGRMAELYPIVTHDIAARASFNADAAACDRNAKDMRGRAADLRASAATLVGKDHDDAIAFAKELEMYALHDDNNAKTKRELAHKLDDVIKTEQASIAWHTAVANRLKTALANNS